MADSEKQSVVLGDVVPHVGKNGNWFVGENDTGTPATGPQGPKGEDGSGGSAMIVNITGNENSGYSADKTFEQIKEAILAGQPVYAFMDRNGLYPLVQGVGSYDTFDQVIFGTSQSYYMDGGLSFYTEGFTITESDNVEYTRLAEDLDGLKNPNALTFTGATSGTYDGSEPVTINIPQGTSVTVSSVVESSADGGSNVVTFSDGKAVTIKNGSKGSTGATGATGPQGPQGEKGATGPQGATGATGATGAKGDKGEKGDKGDKGDPGESAEAVPSDIAEACDTLIEKVRGVLKADSIVSLTMSDAHYATDPSQWSSTVTATVRASAERAGLAAKYIAKRLPLTFAAFLGDYTVGDSVTTFEQAKEHFSDISDFIADAFGGVPNFRTVGNHDCLYSSSGTNGGYLPVQTQFAHIGAWNRGAVFGDQTLGYCYRDFEDRNLRVICLNTNDTNTGEGFTSAQQTWFKNTLAEVGAKSGWNVIVLSHHPLDWGSVYTASNILYDYLNGNSPFSGKNNAKVLLAIHGHVHSFTYNKLYRKTAVSTTAGQFDIYRLGVPNMCFYRNDEYGTTAAYGVVYGEATKYAKTADTAKDTAFTVNVVNPTDEAVYSFCYGAGYDRAFSIAKETIAATGVTVSPTTLALEVGETGTLTATVTPTTATDKTVSWSSSAPAIASVANGVVTALAEGSATITATTSDGGYTATCALTVTAAATPAYTNKRSVLANLTDGSDVFNSTGYMDDAYVSTTSPYYSTDTNCVALGAVVNADLGIGDSAARMSFGGSGSYVYIKGLQFASSHSRVLTIYETTTGFASSNRNTQNITADPTLNVETAVGSFGITVTKLGDKYYKFYLPVEGSGGTTVAAYAFSGIGDSGKNVIVTFNEPIE